MNFAFLLEKISSYKIERRTHKTVYKILLCEFCISKFITEVILDRSISHGNDFQIECSLESAFFEKFCF